ncbi:Hypothetical protein AA314_01248 [Archangium gephyra]|uniref:Uncharacterized protein n=1 Tax=Archangium gephyra TaxID=48 RepID=A0AAC8TBB5_9BACT|nr:Hypothetical protein AA314_01248 [Archangium gephyra]
MLHHEPSPPQARPGSPARVLPSCRRAVGRCHRIRTQANPGTRRAALTGTAPPRFPGNAARQATAPPPPGPNRAPPRRPAPTLAVGGVIPTFIEPHPP